MSKNKDESKAARQAAETYGATEDFITFSIAEQLFGLPVLKVQDVLSTHRITRIPLAPPEIAGSLNLRGRIVTAVDVRRRVGLPPRTEQGDNMSIVVEHEGDLYSLLVDSVGEVLALAETEFERNPPTLDARLREYSHGIYRLNDELLVVLNVTALLSYGHSQAA
ncbi:MAG: chemotaxis protein CheW [Kiloniellales bacterium]